MLRKVFCLFFIFCLITSPANVTISLANNESFVLGDVSGDAKVNSTDITLMKRYILKIISDFPAVYGMKAADVNSDNSINSTDFAWLKKYTLNTIDKFPAESDEDSDSIVHIQSGYSHSVVLKDDGTVWVLGDNSKGQLGLDEVSTKDELVMISGLTGIKSVAAGREHTLVLKEDGALWAWGNNNSLQLIENTEREPGTGERVCRTPFRVEAHSDIRAVTASYSRTLIIKNDGTVWLYSLPPIKISKSTEYTPWEIKGLGNIKMAEIGTGHIVSLRQDGTVWTWGENVWGQLGNGTQQHHNIYDYTSFEPNQAKNLTGIISVAAGMIHSAALKDDGTVWTWGGNFFGEIGDGTTNYCMEPRKVEGIQDITAIDTGSNHTVALKSDGTVWVWGKNEFGQLGNGTTLRSRTPIKVEGLTGIIAIQAGMESTIAYKYDGTIWAWGKNDFGQLGDGTFENSLTPVQIFPRG